MQFYLVNQSADPALTHDVILSIAVACARQQVEDYAPMWQAEPMLVSVASPSAGLPDNACIVKIVDVLDAPGDLGYHTSDSHGRPVAYIGWHVIRDNGGTATKGPNSLSVTISHEILEASQDPYVTWWADHPDGVREIALEVGDPVEGDAYEIGGVSVSNFVGPRYFSGGAGPYDRMGTLSAPFTMSPGGYQIQRTGGPHGQTTDVFGHAMPAWKRAVKLTKHTRRTRRHG